MSKNIEMTLKKVRLPESKSTRLAYAKYVTKVAEMICTLLVMQGDVTSVVGFIEESLPKVVDVSDLPVSESDISESDVQKKPESESLEEGITQEGDVQIESDEEPSEKGVE